MQKASQISRRDFLKVFFSGALSSIIVGIGGWDYASRIEPDAVDVVQVKILLPNLGKEFSGYRLVQVSDLHMDRWMTRQRLLPIIDLINQQSPDLVAITGDFITHRTSTYAPDLGVCLQNLRARDGVVAVLGNHDHWNDLELLRQVLAENNVTELPNRVISLRRGKSQLHICGVDDIWEKKDRLDLVLDQLPTTGAAILMAHEPDFATLSSQTDRFGLQISGHSHGGQVVLPLYGPPILPDYAQKYPLGLYRLGSMLQYTNRGLGMIYPRVRFNCRPEITVFTFG